MAGWYAANTRFGGPLTVTSIPQFRTVIVDSGGSTAVAVPQPASKLSNTTGTRDLRSTGPLLQHLVDGSHAVAGLLAYGYSVHRPGLPSTQPVTSALDTAGGHPDHSGEGRAGITPASRAPRRGHSNIGDSVAGSAVLREHRERELRHRVRVDRPGRQRHQVDQLVVADPDRGPAGRRVHISLVTERDRLCGRRLPHRGHQRDGLRSTAYRGGEHAVRGDPAADQVAELGLTVPADRRGRPHHLRRRGRTALTLRPRDQRLRRRQTRRLPSHFLRQYDVLAECRLGPGDLVEPILQQEHDERLGPEATITDHRHLSLLRLL